VIVISADAVPARLGALAALAPCAVLGKPLDLGEFLRAVDDALARKG
jgi:hypothetical protein